MENQIQQTEIEQQDIIEQEVIAVARQARICETKTHEVIELKAFQECPYCHSESYHMAVIIKENGEIK